MQPKKPLWTLTEALELVRELQPKSREFGFHIALGGGVINKGWSDKDIDVYLLPLGNTATVPAPLKAAAWLDALWGEGEPLTGYPSQFYSLKLKYMIKGKRADVFMVGGQHHAAEKEALDGQQK